MNPAFYKLLGKMLHALRLEADLGLRDFCLKYGLDACDVSKIERGEYGGIPPEQDDISDN